MTLSFDNPASLLRFDDGTRRLIMRPARAADAAEVVAALDESRAEVRAFMLWAHHPQTVDVQTQRLGAIEEAFGKGGDLLYHLYAYDEGPYLGVIGLHRRRMFNPMGFEIGYWMRTSAAGQGLMTLAVQCVVVLGFECMGMERIQCGYNEANEASARVNHKVGFSVEGKLRHFEPTATETMRAQGCITSDHMLMTALFPDDRPRLAWYPGIAASLRIQDSEHNVVWPAPGDAP